MPPRPLAITIAASVSLGVPTPGGARDSPQSSDGAAYAIELRIEDGARLVGTPTMTVRENVPVVITVDKHDGYSLRATFRTEVARGVTRGILSTELFFARDGTWQHRGSPWMSAPLGQSATMEVASGNGAGPLRIAYRATAMANP